MDNGHVAVDRRMASNIRGCFAAGDCTGAPYQIAKAVGRNDLVSINHRTAAFMESYFDILFALNELTHPGGKRLISLCLQQCRILPERFEENLDQLFAHLFTDQQAAMQDIDTILKALKQILP